MGTTIGLVHPPRFVAPLLIPAVLVAMAGLATSCSDDVQLDFVQDNADSFMAACTSTTDDLVIQSEICQCVIDTAQVRLRFSEFDAIEASLTADVPEGAPAPTLPPEIVEIVAECVIEVGEL